MSPSRMRQVVLLGPRQLTVREVEVPEPEPGEVLIRVELCALCTWEQRTYTGEETFVPLLGGHEVTGRVEAINGSTYLDLHPGDRVAISLLNRCGQCQACRRGYDNICEHGFDLPLRYGIPGPAGLSEYLIAKATDLFPMPPSVPPEHVALTEPLACVLRSVKRARIHPGEKVVIIGMGVMGVLHLQLALARGGVVIVSEPNPDRRAAALAMGATAAIDPSREAYRERVLALTDGWGADVTFICVPHAAVVGPAVEAAAKNGRVLMYSSIHPRGTKVELDPNIFHNREVVLTGTMSQSQRDFFEAAQLIAHGLVDLDPLISARYPLEEVQAAFEAALREDTYRVFVTMA